MAEPDAGIREEEEEKGRARLGIHPRVPKQLLGATHPLGHLLRGVSYGSADVIVQFSCRAGKVRGRGCACVPLPGGRVVHERKGRGARSVALMKALGFAVRLRYAGNTPHPRGPRRHHARPFCVCVK